MTEWMRRGFCLLPENEQYSLPPREITEKITELVDIKKELDDEDLTSLTYASHFSYGAAVGIGYGFMESKLSYPPVIKGIGYGIFVWSASYLGLLPALNILTPATQHPKSRNALMIGAHIIWGASTATFFEMIRSRSHDQK